MHDWSRDSPYGGRQKATHFTVVDEKPLLIGTSRFAGHPLKVSL